MRRTWSAMFLAALLALSISACGGAANSIASTSEAPMDQEEGVYQEDFANGFSHGGIEMDDAETAPESIQEALPAGPAEDGREEKVILTARLELETLEFDRAAPALEDLAEDLAYSWVWVLLAAALVLAAVRILRKRRRTSDARAEKTADDKSGEM